MRKNGLEDLCKNALRYYYRGRGVLVSVRLPLYTGLFFGAEKKDVAVDSVFWVCLRISGHHRKQALPSFC